MMNKTGIRTADAGDISLLSGIISDSFRDVAERFALTRENCPKHPSNYTQEWVKNDQMRGVIYYILESDDVPVGCVGLESVNPDLCYLERLAVLPEQRRKGFGKALVDHVMDEATALGVKEIGIGIIAADEELKRWYRKLGFVEGETKEFAHLPFLVTFMAYEVR